MENELTGSLGWGEVLLQKEGMEFVHCPFPKMSTGSVTLHQTAVHGAVLCVSLRSSQIWFYYLKKCIPHLKGRGFFTFSYSHICNCMFSVHVFAHTTALILRTTISYLL